MKYVDSDGGELSIFNNGHLTKYYNSNEELHRIDGPAVIWRDGCFVWKKAGSTHRIGGPAYYLNRLRWFVNGKEINIYYIYG